MNLVFLEIFRVLRNELFLSMQEIQDLERSVDRCFFKSWERFTQRVRERGGLTWSSWLMINHWPFLTWLARDKKSMEVSLNWSELSQGSPVLTGFSSNLRLNGTGWWWGSTLAMFSGVFRKILWSVRVGKAIFILSLVVRKEVCNRLSIMVFIVDNDD